MKHFTADLSGHIALSPPARGRGLKRKPSPRRPIHQESPPARGRGLKHEGGEDRPGVSGSPPARGRGLKRSKTFLSVGAIRRPPRGGVD